MAEQTYDLKRNLIVMLGLQSLPEEKRNEVIEQAIALIQDRILLKLMQEIDDSAVEEAEKLSGKPEQLLDFLVERSGVDLMQLIQQETDRLKGEFMMGTLEDELEELEGSASPVAASTDESLSDDKAL